MEQNTPDDDGVVDEARQREYFGGAGEIPPKSPSTPPQPMQRVPPLQIEKKDVQLLFVPYDHQTKMVHRVETLRVIQVTPEGIKDEFGQRVTKFYGDDGEVIDIEKGNPHRCRTSGAVYSDANAGKCAACDCVLYKPASYPSLTDPQVRLCETCAKSGF